MTTNSAAPVGLPDPAGQTLDIGLDNDGVMYNLPAALRAYIHTKTGRPLYSMPEPTCWEFFSTDWAMTLADFVGFMNAGVNDGYLFRVGEPFPGVADGINRLLAAGHRVHIVTDRAKVGRPGAAETLTRAWFAEHGINFTSLTLTKDKTSVHTDVFLDDRPENYLALVDAGVDAYLRSWPYNTHVPAPADRRVDSFTEFVDRLLAPATVPVA